MAKMNTPNLQGTSDTAFFVGFNKLTFDASALTAPRLWKFPDSDGAVDYVLKTNGLGGLSWTVQAGAVVGVPYFIASTDTFTVPTNYQALFTMPIDIEGDLVVNGYLIEVV